MSELKRYVMTVESNGYAKTGIEERKGGKYCIADDALAIIAERDKRIAELEVKVADYEVALDLIGVQDFDRFRQIAHR